jgi:hypothetical protein
MQYLPWSSFRIHQHVYCIHQWLGAYLMQYLSWSSWCIHLYVYCIHQWLACSWRRHTAGEMRKTNTPHKHQLAAQLSPSTHHTFRRNQMHHTHLSWRSSQHFYASHTSTSAQVSSAMHHIHQLALKWVLLCITYINWRSSVFCYASHTSAGAQVSSSMHHIHQLALKWVLLCITYIS